jgi:hypothetical protein
MLVFGGMARETDAESWTAAGLLRGMRAAGIAMGQKRINKQNFEPFKSTLVEVRQERLR